MRGGIGTGPGVADVGGATGGASGGASFFGQAASTRTNGRETTSARMETSVAGSLARARSLVRSRLVGGLLDELGVDGDRHLLAHDDAALVELRLPREAVVEAVDRGRRGDAAVQLAAPLLRVGPRLGDDGVEHDR